MIIYQMVNLWLTAYDVCSVSGANVTDDGKAGAVSP
jgi:hypothetical protein